MAPPDRAPPVDHPALGAILESAATQTRFVFGRALWGYGGLHGGLALALLTRGMRERAGGLALRRVSGHFQRSLRGEFDIDVQADRVGNTVTWLSASARDQGATALAATAIFTTPGPPAARSVPATMPAAPPPHLCAPLDLPIEHRPLGGRAEIRPVGDTRPYAGGPTAELTAWVRLLEDDATPNDERVVVLMDTIAPSYVALLHAPVPVPTVTFTVTFSAASPSLASPWLLLRARTDLAGADGWLHERLDAWSQDGTHLASAEQLRVVRPAAR